MNFVMVSLPVTPGKTLMILGAKQPLNWRKSDRGIIVSVSESVRKQLAGQPV